MGVSEFSLHLLWVSRLFCFVLKQRFSIAQAKSDLCCIEIMVAHMLDLVLLSSSASLFSI